MNPMRDDMPESNERPTCGQPDPTTWTPKMVKAFNEFTPPVVTRYAKPFPGGGSHDVYDVLKAFGVTCPAVAHAVKKLLCAGQRGHKDRLTDLREAMTALARAAELERSGS